MKCVVLSILMLCVAAYAVADAERDADALAAENAALRARVAALEAQNAELAGMLRSFEARLEKLLGTPAVKPPAALFRKHAKNYVAVGENFYRLPPMDFRFSNSRGATPPPPENEAAITKIRVLEDSDRLLLREDEIKHWKTRLPKWEVGAFGRIPGATIRRILGPDDCIVTCQLVTVSKPIAGTALFTDLDTSWQNLRIFGWNTANKVDRDTLPAGEIAIIGTWQEYAGGRSLLLAVPVELAKRGLDEHQFAALLASGVDPDADAKAAITPAGK